MHAQYSGYGLPDDYKYYKQDRTICGQWWSLDAYLRMRIECDVHICLVVVAVLCRSLCYWWVGRWEVVEVSVDDFLHESGLIWFRDSDIWSTRCRAQLSWSWAVVYNASIMVWLLRVRCKREILTFCHALLIIACISSCYWSVEGS